MEPVSITAIIISVISAVGVFVKETHIQKCKTLCCESDCREGRRSTPPETPIEIQPKRDLNHDIENEVTEI